VECGLVERIRRAGRERFHARAQRLGSFLADLRVMQCLRARTGRAAHAVIAAARRVLDLLEDGGAPYACECGAAQLRGAVVNGDAREYGLIVDARNRRGTYSERRGVLGEELQERGRATCFDPGGAHGGRRLLRVGACEQRPQACGRDAAIFLVRRPGGWRDRAYRGRSGAR
jgi:hypothetical protein